MCSGTQCCRGKPKTLRMSKNPCQKKPLLPYVAGEYHASMYQLAPEKLLGTQSPSHGYLGLCVPPAFLTVFSGHCPQPVLSCGI